MKNLFIPIAIGILIHMNSDAAPGNSSLKVREIDHRTIRVQLNHGLTSHASRSIHFDDLIPGTHHIRVWVKNGPRRREEFILAYAGPIQIPANSDVRTILHRNGQLKVFEVFPLNPAHHVSCEPIPVGPCGGPFQFGIDEGAFQHILTAMDHTPFDQTRLQIASQAIASQGRIRTDQVELIMSRLSFESSRLALAKHAYFHTVDPGNYYRLFPLFRFDSSIRELSSFIAGGGV